VLIENSHAVYAHFNLSVKEEKRKRGRRARFLSGKAARFN
jgi:hypothetical protein